MASSNPFRKSVLQPKAADSTLPPLDHIDTTQTYAAPPRTSFRDPEPSDADDDPEPERKLKPVKKVRVLTPPPLSPDSPEWPAVESMYKTGAGLVPPPVDYDPFGGSATDESDRDGTATPPYRKPAVVAFAAAPPAPGAPPGNPFSRTLQDMEDASSKEELDLQQREEGEVLKAANAGTPTLNVDAFKRLLLTGHSGAQGSQPSADDQGLASINAEANKIVAAPEGTQESNQINSDKGTLQQGQQRVVSPSTSNKDKKLVPPPPPSSRHGKTIKSEQPKPTQPESEHPSVPPETKPTQIPSGDALESASDEDSSTDSPAHEAAAVAAAPSNAKKPAPAPPPRRGHARSDTRSNPPPAPSKPNDDEPEPRSSIDSTHRQIPAPPPPRRPHAAPKQSGGGGAVGGPSSPSASPSSIPQRGGPAEPLPSTASPSGAAASSKPASKAPVPPRPPARNSSSSSTRRPLGGGGGGGGSYTHERRESTPQPPPPPPPPRHRGSSSPTRTSSSSRADRDDAAAAALDRSKGADILADLDALRREVEALRGAR